MAAWDHTADLTGHVRHRATAATCRAIAVERLQVALVRQIAADDRQRLFRAGREILVAAEQEASRASTAEIRAILARLAPEAGPL